MLLTSSHFHLVFHMSLLVSGSTRTTCTLRVSLRRGEAASAGRRHSFGPKSAVAALSSQVSPCAVSSPPSASFLSQVMHMQKGLDVCIRSPNALCQLAVPTVTEEIHLF